ncbi:MAG TPA: hypothetical protein EYQ64_11930 [Gemmatimonadetes bacterium]|nr:hypothetical protein [Gemmatimonadota bacterium]
MAASWVALAIGVFSLGSAVAASPSGLSGQASGPSDQSWSMGFAAGSFNYESSGDQGFPIYAVRFDQPTSEWARFEMGVSYVRPEVQTDAVGNFDPALPSKYSNLVTFTLGLQGRWMLGPLEPYAGIAVGFFGRYDNDFDGRRFSSSTFAFPVGIRIWATDHIGVRGEFRFNQDGHQVVTRSDSEMTAGLFWTF